MANHIKVDQVQIVISSNKKPYFHGTVAKSLWLYCDPEHEDLSGICYDDLIMVLEHMNTKEDLIFLKDNYTIAPHEGGEE